ncbi:hypothetical protein VV869_01710 [Photobacterium sp. MCCC 1A19761]|uniref:hypothetical protein n=1 Tax=Photobacterium sp. MCCC 1A19761 TaxID=3115000 RepID=UPI00307DD247
MKYKILAVAVSSVLGLVGCGGGDSSSGKVTPVISTADFAGTVNKGILSNAKVEVCDSFDTQGCHTSAGYYQQTVTNASGKYSVQGAPLDKPILVAVSKKDGSTTMKCDVEQCVDNNGITVGFGQSFVVSDGWQLKTILPAANTATDIVNVTSLTDIAAKQALEDAGSSAVTTEGANVAKEVVEKLFGLEGSITELGAVDLTDPMQTESASPEEMNAALYSAAVMSSAVDTEAMIQNNAGAYQISPTVLKIIDAAEKLVSRDQGEPLVKVSSASQKKLDDHKHALTQGEGSFKDIDNDGTLDPIEIVPQPPSTEAVQAAKAFINDVRTTYMSVQNEGDLKSGLENFAAELEDVAPLAESDAQQVVFNVQQAVEAIAAFYLNTPDKAPEGIQVKTEIKDAGTEYTATRTDTSTGSVTVVALVKQFEEGNENTPTNIDLEITGVRSQYQAVTLAAKGIAKVVNATFTDKNSETTSEPIWTYDSEFALKSDRVSLELSDVSLAVTREGAQPAEFTGLVSLNVENPTSTGAESLTGNEGNVSGNEQLKAHFAYAKIQFSGDIATGTDSLGVYLNLIADNKRGYQHSEWTEMFRYCDYWYPFHCTEQSQGDHSAESADEFVETYFTVEVKTNVKNALNNAIAASVKLEIDRAEFDVATAKVTVHYNDVDTIIESPVGLYDNPLKPSVTVRNTTGAVAMLSSIEEEVAGLITINGEKVASIQELDSGLVLVRYRNGDFETLF